MAVSIFLGQFKSGCRTWLDRKVQNLVYRLNLLVRRRMENNNDGSNQTYRAANFAQKTELFVQEVCSQHSANEHRKCSEGSHENGGRECVCCEVEDLAEYHWFLSARILSRLSGLMCAHLLLCPPTTQGCADIQSRRHRSRAFPWTTQDPSW